jgi:hypothetical protein
VEGLPDGGFPEGGVVVGSELGPTAFGVLVGIPKDGVAVIGVELLLAKIRYATNATTRTPAIMYFFMEDMR